MNLPQTKISRSKRPWLALLLAGAVMAFSGCNTLEQVGPEGKPAEKAEKPQTQRAQTESKVKPPKDLSKTMARGGKQPVVQRPVSDNAQAPKDAPPASPAPAPTDAEAIPVPPETDVPVAVNLDQIREDNPIDQKAESLLTALGKINSSRAVLLQINADVKPHYHVYHDEIIYVVKGKGILFIGDDRHVAAPGALFIIPRNTTNSLKITGEKPLVALVIEVPPAAPKDIWTPKFQ